MNHRLRSPFCNGPPMVVEAADGEEEEVAPGVTSIGRIEAGVGVEEVVGTAVITTIEISPTIIIKVAVVAVAVVEDAAEEEEAEGVVMGVVEDSRIDLIINNNRGLTIGRRPPRRHLFSTERSNKWTDRIGWHSVGPSSRNRRRRSRRPAPNNWKPKRR